MIMTINEMYKYCRDNNLKLLSNYTADFWQVYRENSDYFDRLFRNSYRTFIPFSLKEAEDEDELITEWIYDIVSFLKMNEKRYDELYRLQVLSDEAYDPLNNFHIRETFSGSESFDKSTTLGAHTDTKSNIMQYGAATRTETNSYTNGAKSETDSETYSYGQDSTTTNTTMNTGAQTNTSENKVSADNVDTYAPKDHNTTSLGAREDGSSETETRASHSDTKSGTHTEAAVSNSESKSATNAAHSDSESATNIYGAQINGQEYDSESEHTSNRVGNTGVYSSSRLLDEHKLLWESFNFYKFIFDEIANEFLRIEYI